MRSVTGLLGWVLIVLTTLAPITAWCSTGTCDRPAIDTGCCNQTDATTEQDENCDDCFDLSDNAVPDRIAATAVAILPAAPLASPQHARGRSHSVQPLPTGPPRPSGTLRDLRTVRLLI
ncbi:MAG: hypothetical protein PF961_00190 [Planctomycetota bacterium]|jgi:hypothetical protein|nr:hypothetical protein [Planctomycetota bacterium]